MKIIVNTSPPQEAVLYDTIKITVDGPREPRKRKPSTSESKRVLSLSTTDAAVLMVRNGC
jgi:hypothetical protein